MSVSSVSLTEEVVRATQCQVEVQLTVEKFSFADLSCRLEYGPNRDISKGIICHDFRRFESAAPTVRSHFEMENTVQNSGFHILAVRYKAVHLLPDDNVHDRERWNASLPGANS